VDQAGRVQILVVALLQASHKIMSYIRRYLISGLLVWLPIWVTILVIKFLVDILDNTLLLLPVQYRPDALLGFHVPGVGVVITLFVILLTGVIAANFIGKSLVEFSDAVIGRIPLVRTVYSSVKQVAQTLFTPGGQSFRKVFLIEYPRAGSWTVAFQTGDAAKEIAAASSLSDMISLYVPTTPNPTSGFLLFVPRANAIELNISVEQALKYVISLGVMQPALEVIKGKRK
jgi:uncharacterized membrane protein